LRRVRWWIVAVAVGLASWLGFGLPSADGPVAPPDLVTGKVLHSGKPVAGAVVRLQGSLRRTRSSPSGSFELRLGKHRAKKVITAWAPGHYIGWATLTGNTNRAVIHLRKHYQSDNPDYGWFSAEGAHGSASCGHCMPQHYEEWLGDAHAQSAVNPRFLTVYEGTDTQGNKSPLTRYVSTPDYMRTPLPVDRTKPYYGPGYKLDFPDSTGNCATCHVPAAAAKPGKAYDADPTHITGIEREGIFCEFCHKIGGVVLDPKSRLPYPNRPGVLSMRLYRPARGEELFFGTFDDVTRRVTYLPLQSESAFCAPCHYGVFWDTVVYNSYGEWLDSPYSNPETGQTCQDCHMLPTKDRFFVLPEKGGVERPPGRIFNHRMTGVTDVALMTDTARLDVAAARRQDRITVAVQVTNEKGGHHIPTDHPSRQILLIVQACGRDGQALPYLGDVRLPWWAGQGDEPDDYAGRPGKAFAKILQESWTGAWPSIAYWNPTVVREDTRIPALGTDISRYEFRAPSDGGPVTIQARLIFRRAFKHLARQKKWDLTDMLMERKTVQLP